MPSFQQLRYLVALDDHRHFRRAAEHCHVTQPTLSAQIRDLERKLGVDLVERGHSPVVLSAVGRTCVAHARRALREVTEIRRLARLSHSVLASTIRVGIVQSLGSYFLPLIVPDLHQSHPDLRLYVREGLPEMLTRALADGDLDLLFFPLPLSRAEFETRSIFREPILVVAPHDHRLMAQDSVDPSQLRGETVLSLEPGHKLYEQVSRLCETYGAELSHDFEGTSLDTLRQMVAMGMGLSLMPALYVQSEVAHQDIVAARPFRGTPPARTIGMVWRRGTSLEADYLALLDRICDILAERAPNIAVMR